MARGSNSADAITVEAGALAKAMKHAAAVVEARVVVPILSNVRLVAEGDTLEITTSDLDVEFCQRIPLATSGPFAGTVEARRLRDLASAVEPGAQIRLTLDGARLAVSAGRSRWLLPALPVEDFPRIPVEDLTADIEMSCAALSLALGRTLPFVSTEQTKFYIGGVFLDPEEDKLRLTATDGYRLLTVTTATAWPADAPTPILGAKFCHTLRALAGENDGPVTLAWDERKVRARVGAVTLIGKLIDGSFPDYRRAVPPEGEPSVIDPKTLLAALRRIDLVGERRDRLVKIERSEGKLTIAARTEIGSEAVEEILGDVAGEHASGFNSQYLGTLAEAIGGDSIEIHQADAGSAALIRRVVPDGAVAVLWPVRI